MLQQDTSTTTTTTMHAYDPTSSCSSSVEDPRQKSHHPLHNNCSSAASLRSSVKIMRTLSVIGLTVTGANALAATSTKKAAALMNDVRLPIQKRLVDSAYPIRSREPAAWTEAFFDDSIVEDEVPELHELQRSTGSEIPNAELQRQIEEGKVDPKAFLDAHVQDASMLEKVAMSSIPQQLPRPALAALSKEKRRKTKNNKKKPGLAYARGRVTHEQELELARQIQKGVALHKLKTDYEAKHGCEISRPEWTKLAKLDSPKELRRQVLDYRRAKQLLVEANMGLVHAVVESQYNAKSAYMGGIGKEELIQEGSLGLMRAAELFDPSRGLRFSTYATIWIKGVLSNSHLVEPITLPQRERTKWTKICKANDDLAEELRGARDPTPQELSERLGMSVEEIMATKRKMTQAKQVLSLDYEYRVHSRSGDDSGGFSVMGNDKNFMADVEMAEQTQLRADVVAALAQNLDAREARLMRLRYGLSDGVTRSIAECADAMGLSKSRAQQLAARCLKKLREAHDASSLQEYLLTIA